MLYFSQKNEFEMIVGTEALEVLAYLKTSPGNFVPLGDISRRAGGRRKFDESPDWARGLMPSLVDAGLVEVNERGHYRVPAGTQPLAPPKRPSPAPRNSKTKIVGDDYFPTSDGPNIVEGDYFPSSD
jgi:hypothetical protein